MIHVYVLDDAGRVDPTARAATLTLQQGATEIEADLLASGPGHWTVLNQSIPVEGEWIVLVSASTDSGRASATGAITVR